MIRFILRNRVFNAGNGTDEDRLYTLDTHCPDLEEQLTVGGYSENSSHRVSLKDAMVIPRPESHSDESSSTASEDLLRERERERDRLNDQIRQLTEENQKLQNHAIKKELEGSPDNIAKLSAAASDVIANLQETIKEKDSRAEDLADQLSKTQGMLRASEKALEEQSKTVRQLSSENQGLKNQRIEALDEVEVWKNNAKESTDRRNELKEEIAGLKNVLRGVNIQYELRTGERDAAHRRISELTEELEFHRRSVEDNHKESTELCQKLEAATRTIEDLKSLIGKVNWDATIARHCLKLEDVKRALVQIIQKTAWVEGSPDGVKAMHIASSPPATAPGLLYLNRSDNSLHITDGYGGSIALANLPPDTDSKLRGILRGGAE